MHGFEKSQALAREAWKMHFCTQRRVFTHAHYYLDLIMQKDSRVVQIIIGHKPFLCKLSRVGSGTRYIFSYFNSQFYARDNWLSVSVLLEYIS